MCPYFVLKATSQPPQLWNMALPDAVARSEPHHGASLRMALGRYCQRASPPGRDIYPGITCPKKNWNMVIVHGHGPSMAMSRGKRNHKNPAPSVTIVQWQHPRFKVDQGGRRAIPWTFWNPRCPGTVSDVLPALGPSIRWSFLVYTQHAFIAKSRGVRHIWVLQASVRYRSHRPLNMSLEIPGRRASGWSKKLRLPQSYPEIPCWIVVNHRITRQISGAPGSLSGL